MNAVPSIFICFEQALKLPQGPYYPEVTRKTVPKNDATIVRQFL